MSSTSIFHAFAFSPSYRIFTARVLYMTTTMVLGFVAADLLWPSSEDINSPIVWTGFITSLCIVGHQIYMQLFTSSAVAGSTMYAAIDMALIFAEVAAITFYLHGIAVYGPFSHMLLAAISVQLLAVAVSGLFRACTMVRLTSVESVFKQRFDFFGGCARHRKTEIFFAAFLGPGESPIIIFIRALALTFLWLALIIIAENNIIFVPIFNSKIATRTFVPSAGAYNAQTAARIAIGVELPFGPALNASAVNVTGRAAGPLYEACPAAGWLNRSFPAYIAECPQSGNWAKYNGVAVSLDFSGFAANETTLAYVYVGEGDLDGSVGHMDPIILVPGAHILVSLTFNLRTVFSHSLKELLGFSSAAPPLVINTVGMVQQDPSPPDAGLQTATVRLIRVYRGPSEQVEDYDDTSVLTGISFVGGFWTFMSGVVAFLFGADAAYFLFARRPLSATGFLHLFQGQGLLDKWHADFPRIRTEGGRPRTAEAGFVAFYRDRCLDLDDEDSNSNSNSSSPAVNGGDGDDVETQRLTAGSGREYIELAGSDRPA
ncbi:hypothetical protein FB451DRAFT_1399072 [Mycena latifolia]|nr:hypothetical protein FB451DRAFT_1399072 [Mycena latifolia]